MGILTHSSALALWHGIVQEAETSCAISLTEDLESYLVFLLMRHTRQPEAIHQIMALKFLEGMQSLPAKQALLLQEVGDKCLLFTGLYPKMAAARLVKLSYFIQMGQAAYVTISKKNDDLYNLLSTRFVILMDILQAVRHSTQQTPDLLPLEAYELWNETGSQRALKILQQYTPHAIPVVRNK